MVLVTFAGIFFAKTYMGSLPINILEVWLLDVTFGRNWFRSHPLRAASLIVIVAVASVAAAYAYISVRLPQAGPQVSVVSHPLKLAIGLDKTEFKPDENITVGCSVENIGNETITITFSSIYGYVDNQNNFHEVYFDFIITDATNTEIYKWSYRQGALGSTYEVTLKPGEELKNTFTWKQNTNYADVLVSTGTYFIKGIMPPGRSEFQINHGPWISLETPSMTFAIN